jgi:putative endonuclease
MSFVYLLQSEVDDTFYIGLTEDVTKRLREHNRGETYYTRRKMPWKLVYYESYATQVLAREREKQLKRFGSAYMALLKRLKLK